MVNDPRGEVRRRLVNAGLTCEEAQALMDEPYDCIEGGLSPNQAFAAGRVDEALAAVQQEINGITL